jgi:hypothetical protein
MHVGAAIVRCKLVGFFREPLVHFLAIGTGFFLLWHFIGDRVTAQPQHIVITPGHVERLAEQWTKTHLRPPSVEELAGLVEQEIDEEILYREAVAMGLDRDDLVIRRRLAVKMEFLTDDVATLAVPTDEQLQTFLSQHPEKFNVESLTTLAHVYINKSQRGDGAASEAERVLTQLNARTEVDWQSLGDPLPLPNEYAAATEADIAKDFGREFAKKLSGFPVGRWSGPVESTFGLHLILVRARTPKNLPPLIEVRDSVLTEWRAAQRQELTDTLRRQRRARYAVTVEWPDWAKEAVTPPSGHAAPGSSR